MSVPNLANTVIGLIHLMIIVFVVIVPLNGTRIWPLDILHITVVISLIIHWWMNNDACFLTLLESWVRQVPSTSSFMHKLISPVYKISDHELSILIKVCTWSLGAISMYHVWNKRGFILKEVQTLYNS